ncbi:MAG: biotin--[Clostridia bacterium]|nr:biotin--[acetyl-CoA-carboxylase] ligase [Clostridia bacterium]
MKNFKDFLKNKKIEYFDEISSTNTILKERAIKGEPENTIIVAEYQTAGRGRLGKTFFSPRGCGVYLSYLIKPDILAQDAVFITVAAAVAMVRALDEVLGIKTQIKWVNDIYYCDKKLCGILTESSIKPDGTLNFAVLGIGLNIKNPPCGYPKEFAYKTTNIENCAGKITNVQKCELFAAFINIFDSIFLDKERKFIKEYKEASCLINREIEILSGKHSGTARVIDIDDNANLVVEKSDGTKISLSSGDVSIKLG